MKLHAHLPPLTYIYKQVDTVNAFLDDATLAGAGLALSFALDEPVQLGTLMTVRGLSTTGLQAAGTLAINFPSIPENLNDTIAGKQSLTTATTNINLNRYVAFSPFFWLFWGLRGWKGLMISRCCTILPNINVLWIEAAAASGAGVPPPIQFENTCADIDCPEGASPEPAE